MKAKLNQRLFSAFAKLMTHKQKIWFYLGLALFAIPELLWSPVSNLVYEFSQTGNSGGTYPLRETFLSDLNNINWLSFVLFIQFIGIAILVVSLLCLKNKTWQVWLLVSAFSLLALLVLVLFGLSVSLRNIGF